MKINTKTVCYSTEITDESECEEHDADLIWIDAEGAFVVISHETQAPVMCVMDGRVCPANMISYPLKQSPRGTSLNILS